MNDDPAAGRAVRVILIADGAAFTTRYVTAVLDARGIAVHGPTTDVREALAVAQAQGVHAAIVSHPLPVDERGRLLVALRQRALPYLSVMTTASAWVHDDGPMLSPPFAAYQVADWVLDQAPRPVDVASRTIRTA